MNNFIKVDDMFININSIDGIFPVCNRWSVLVNGKEICVDDITPILKAINLNEEPFDPNKRIAPTVNNTDDYNSEFMKAAALIRGVIIEHNNKYSPTNELTLEVDKDKRSILIMDSVYSLIRIIDGLIVEDSIPNTETFAEMKRKINDILIGYWMG